MNAAPIESGGVVYDPDDHGCDGEPYARVTVDDTRIPVINDGVRTEMRKDGAMDITTHSEVYFPAEWNGERYEAAVRALDPDEANVYDPVDIEVRNAQTGEYRLLHRGFVMGVGSGQRGSLERRMTVGDVGQLLGAIPFDERYGFDASLADIVQDVLAELRKRIVPQVFPSVTLRDTGVLDTELEGPDLSIGFFEPRLISFVDEISDALTKRIGTAIEFVGNKDTAADALDEVSQRLGDDSVLYFAPDDGDGIALVADTYGGYSETRTLFAQHVDDSSDDVRVLRNNALHEIRPLNALTVEGRVKNGEYPYASAVHAPLYERAGMVLEEVDGPIDATSIEEAQQIATSRLKQRIDDTGLGEIAMKPAPNVRPYTTIVSQPACGTEVSRASSPLEYEVESVVHRVAAKASDRDDDRLHETQVRASMVVREEDIVTPDEESGYRQSDKATLLDEIILGPILPNYDVIDAIPITRHSD
ncbi:hypothetical protein PN419_00290 [Halorubrum ezzemoulense]|uniref:hypothetical protein n=1 Tax=Halorubrum ezzemoulense TaxID=337243 RepID=UPI00232F8485|nr:hypothetical protein [Halorubrum ezzemoulense]MDB9247445.1 hypothetical protein [Halorubrum ezzemoulense]MDB9258646.1 hypothetical protein [Halorubrum ezzemoulense]MDB9264496.1 hypothetical protein [Halorubrum ezzemoulense]MDB9269007.1 hypothetical protein [Halorubrum ezzemoulense]MDB9271464.1 hypothetical protein [Halorubrum ezzemoulense]